MEAFSMKKDKQERMYAAAEDKVVSDRSYNLTIGLVLLWGFGLNYLMATKLSAAILGLNPIVLLIGYMVLSFGSIFLIHRSSNPAVSFLGFTVLSLAMGAILTFALQAYTNTTIEKALITTILLIVIMIGLSVLNPAFFLSIGRVLGISLVVCILANILLVLIFRMDLVLLDWAVALIFCGYIGYDWAVSQQYSKTLDHAIDSAADLYVDIINLFIRLLAIFGRRDD